jgi:hypothetical protein
VGFKRRGRGVLLEESLVFGRELDPSIGRAVSGNFEIPTPCFRRDGEEATAFNRTSSWIGPYLSMDGEGKGCDGIRWDGMGIAMRIAMLSGDGMGT